LAGRTATIAALAKDKAPAETIRKVELLKHSVALEFTQDGDGLKIKLPAQQFGEHAFAFKITALTLK
jgi:hypothetical protein